MVRYAATGEALLLGGEYGGDGPRGISSCVACMNGAFAGADIIICCGALLPAFCTGISAACWNRRCP